jgi:hypothetical protein
MTGLDEPITQPPPPVTPQPAPVPAVGEQTTTHLVADIADDAGTLLTQHANLFQAEMRDGFRAAKWWAMAAVSGAVLLVVGALFVFISAVHGLRAAVPTLPEWACWLIVGGSLLVLGGVLAAVGGKYLFGISLIPNRTIKSLSETWSWLVKRSK